MIYKLERIDKTDTWDSYAGFVVRAYSDTNARQVAAAEGGCEWLSEKFATCKLISYDGPSNIILSDYHNG